MSSKDISLQPFAIRSQVASHLEWQGSPGFQLHSQTLQNISCKDVKVMGEDTGCIFATPAPAQSL